MDRYQQIIADSNEANKDRWHEMRKQAALEHKNYGSYIRLCLPMKYRGLYDKILKFSYTFTVFIIAHFVFNLFK